MSPPNTLEGWMAAVRAAERDGELLAAVDLAEQALADHPESVWLKHRAVLGLARAGSTTEAERRYADYRLGDVDDQDARALAARIAKDRALATVGSRREQLATESAELYRQIFDRDGGYYPGVNAATMTLVAGDAQAARALASSVLEELSRAEDRSYYAIVSEAEALLLLGRVGEARAALESAAALNDDDFGALSTTRRQLRLVCAETGQAEDVLAALAGPSVCHYCGHRIGTGPASRFPPDDEPSVAREIAFQVDRLAPGYGYGALANGADIMWAEALLARGAKLHVILPFATAEFIDASVADGGPEWVARFERCLAAAESVSFATDDAYLGDDQLFGYGTDLAMGLALQRARYLDSAVVQLAVWDGVHDGGEAGTGADVAKWRRHGHEAVIVTPPSQPKPGNPPAPPTPRVGGPPPRVVRAVVFGDIRGYSKLTDEQLPVFNDHVLGAFGDVLARFATEVEFKNTWGDGIYVVLTDAAAAAACALELQRVMGSIDLVMLGLPDHLALRLSAHVGPVFPVYEPVLGVDTFIGTHISRTARIEPVTPAGAVYVTEPFSASLTLHDAPMVCDYVGHLPAAKDFGRLRMYRLHG